MNNPSQHLRHPGCNSSNSPSRTSRLGAALAWTALLVAPAGCTMEGDDPQQTPAPTVSADREMDTGVSPLIESPGAVLATIARLEEARVLNGEALHPGELLEIQQEYFSLVEKQTVDHLLALYAAENAGRIFHPEGSQGPNTEEPPELQPGVVYQFFGGYTTHGEHPPDDGVPGLARIPKRFLRELENGQIARIDANEGYELSVVDGEVEAKLVEIRVHFTSDVRTGVGHQLFHRLHVTWEGGRPHLHSQPDFTPENTPIDIGDASHLLTPNSCLDCHVGTVAFDRTDGALLHQFPELDETTLDEWNDDAFRFDNFIPDRVYLGSAHPGLSEVLSKWEPALREDNDEVLKTLAKPETFRTGGLIEALRRLERSPEY